MKNKYHIGLKTFWEKEELLVTSNFSFSHNVFYSYISLVCQNVALCGNGIIQQWLPTIDKIDINLKLFIHTIRVFITGNMIAIGAPLIMYKWIRNMAVTILLGGAANM